MRLSERGNPVKTHTTAQLWVQVCVAATISTQLALGQDNDQEPTDDGLRLTLLFDVSNSTTGLTAVSQAVGIDLVERLNEGRDVGQVITFGQKVSIVQEFTSDRGRLKSAIMALHSESSTTSLFNAIYIAFRGASEPDDQRRRDVIVVVSDGDDTGSLVTEENLKGAAASSAAAFYAITVKSRRGSDVGVLRALAKATGGQAFEPRDTQEVEMSCREIAVAMARGKRP